jgi:hypothetical protein
VTLRGLLKGAVAAALACALAAPASAVPTVRGATGLIQIPTAQIAQSTGLVYRANKIQTSGTQPLMFMEGGFLNRDGKTIYDAKLQILPDITSEDEWIPGIAIGMRGVGNNPDREWYAVVSKNFSFPKFTIAYGMSKRGSWSRSKYESFYGVEVPLFFGLSLVADRDGRTDATNAGARWRWKNVVVYDYVEDFRNPQDRKHRNVVGVCYQSQF